MNPNNNLTARIHEIVTKGTSCAIILPNNPSPDAIAASCSLYLGLTKLGKTVSLVCASEINLPEIIATDKIQSSLTTGGNNLVASFPYVDGSIDKVDYNIQGNNFNLIITPRSGYQKLDSGQVQFSYTGGNLDFIITVDVPSLNSLGAIYADNQDKFQGVNIINIDRHLTNNFFGTINFVNKASSSISELVLNIFQTLQIEIDKDMATNLYFGIASATNNFTSYSVNANTFETVAALLRVGAVKKVSRKPVKTEGGQSNFPVNQMPTPTILPEKPIVKIEKEVRPDEPPPQDWLKPKIFRGGDLM